MKLPQAAHEQDSTDPSGCEAYHWALRSPLIILEAERRVGVSQARGMLSTYPSHIDIPLTVEYGLSEHLSCANLQETPVASETWEGLLCVSPFTYCGWMDLPRNSQIPYAGEDIREDISFGRKSQNQPGCSRISKNSTFKFAALS